MRALLDTHSYLWWVTGDPRLSEAVREVIEDGRNEVLLSVASAWEVAIKSALGRLELANPIDELLPDNLARNGFRPLTVELPHALRVARLPPIHRDPFDRLYRGPGAGRGLAGPDVRSGDHSIRGRHDLVAAPRSDRRWRTVDGERPHQSMMGV